MAVSGAPAAPRRASVETSTDQIVPPGTNIRADDAGYQPPSLTDASLRSR